jgi:hypothetical protein
MNVEDTSSVPLYYNCNGLYKILWLLIKRSVLSQI